LEQFDLFGRKADSGFESKSSLMYLLRYGVQNDHPLEFILLRPYRFVGFLLEVFHNEISETKPAPDVSKFFVAFFYH